MVVGLGSKKAFCFVFCWLGLYQGLRGLLIMNNFLMGLSPSIYLVQGPFFWKDGVWVQCLGLLLCRVTYPGM